MTKTPGVCVSTLTSASRKDAGGLLHNEAILSNDALRLVQVPDSPGDREGTARTAGQLGGPSMSSSAMDGTIAMAFSRF